jgi:hypothetical protein
MTKLSGFKSLTLSVVSIDILGGLAKLRLA